MAKIDPIPTEHIESISKILGECGSGSEIDTYLLQAGIQDNSGHSTKWRFFAHK